MRGRIHKVKLSESETICICTSHAVALRASRAIFSVQSIALWTVRRAFRDGQGKYPRQLRLILATTGRGKNKPDSRDSDSATVTARTPEGVSRTASGKSSRASGIEACLFPAPS
eukprot:727221-Rhodomonas_salina.1